MTYDKMCVKMIDVTEKGLTYREAIAEGVLRTRHADLKGLEVAGVIAEVSAISAVKHAWRYIPLLHPIPLTYISAKSYIENDALRLMTRARTIAQTGVEMDVLFGVAIGLLNALNVLKRLRPHSEFQIGGIHVVKKVKEVRLEEPWGHDVRQILSPGSLMYDATDDPLFKGEASSVAILKLREETIRRILNGNVEKGDPRLIARLCGVEFAKKTWELLIYSHPVQVTHVDVNVDVFNRHVRIISRVKCIGRTGCALESLASALVSALCVWDVVKKYEKNEEGQYPETEIECAYIAENLKKVVI